MGGKNRFKYLKVVAMTLHPVLGRDSSVQDPMRWHAYSVTFRNDGNNIPRQPHDLCIASIDTSPVTGISFDGKKINCIGTYIRSACQLDSIIFHGNRFYYTTR
jgi:hypothetical protein